MQLFQTDDHYILHDGDYSLWCCRQRGTLEAKKDSEWRLLAIKQRSLVGTIAGKHEIYKINKIAVISLSDGEPQELDLDLCMMHHFGIKKPQTISQMRGQQKQLQNAWKSIKTGVENVKPKKRESKDKEKFIKRIIEELLKMYNESDSFYYSETLDLTRNIQQQHLFKSMNSDAPFQNVDPRFFWNSHMLSDLIETQDVQGEDEELRKHWIIPVIQGYVQLEQCVLDFTKSPGSTPSDLCPEFGNNRALDPLEYKMGIISRRSIHRAGTRTKMRGLDDKGSCANYVETEQIIEFSHHITSFVQVRGSVPVYWSQSGYKYRPPPRIDKGEKETHEAFCKHFDEQLGLFRSIACINLAQLTGKEKALSDAYLRHLLEYNSQDITYVSFDFHEYCRGMKFENVSILTDGIKDIIRSMRYCWVDKNGMICEQRGVFRVNCVDCLDRTNVVQTAIARIVMETQLRKLGILPPDEVLPLECKKTFQQLWANNGDAISQQYAGTAALKGDFTRTGERKITGMMKDGVNSANRYYLRFKDSNRQATIELTLGQMVSDELLMVSSKLDQEDEEDSNELLEKEENLKMLIEDCKKMLVVEPEQCMGGWSLINADPVAGDEDRQDMDIILLLSQRSVYVAWYSDAEEDIVQYQRIFLEDIEMIEIGAEAAIFKPKFLCLRLHYRHYAEEGFFHTFRIPRVRLFNNMVVKVKTQEEERENLRAIYQAFAAAQEILSMKLELLEKQKMDRKKTRLHPEIQDVHNQQQEKTLSNIHIPRDISSPDLNAVKALGISLPRARSQNGSPTANSPVSSPRTGKRTLFPLPNLTAIKKNFNLGLKFNLQGLKFGKGTDTNQSNDCNTVEARKKGTNDDPDAAQRRRLSSQSSQDDSEIERRRSIGNHPPEHTMVLNSCGVLETGKVVQADMLEKENDNLQRLLDNGEKKKNQLMDKDSSEVGATNLQDNSAQKMSTSADSQGAVSKLPKIQVPSQLNRKTQRIIESIEQDIVMQLGDRECNTKLMFL